MLSVVSRGASAALLTGAVWLFSLPAFGGVLLIQTDVGGVEASDRVCVGSLCQPLEYVPVCALKTTGQTLLSVTGGGPNGTTVSYTGGNSDTFGILGTTRNGGAICGRVNGKEWLALSLGAHESVAGKYVTKATLPLNMKANSRVKITTTVGNKTFSANLHGRGLGSSQGATVTLQEETNGTTIPTYYCGGTTDSCQIQVVGSAWTALNINGAATVSSNTEWSLGAANLELEFYDDVVACYDTIYFADPLDPTNTIRRVGDGADVVDGQCATDPIPYTVDFDGTELQFITASTVNDPAFEWRVTWNPQILELTDTDEPNRLGTAGSLVPATGQKFLANDPEYLVDVCVGQPLYDDDATPPELTDLLLYPDDPTATDFTYAAYDMSSAAGIQYGCVLDRKIEVLPPSSCGITDEVDEVDDLPRKLCVQKTERGYVRGDWLIKSTCSTCTR